MSKDKKINEITKSDIIDEINNDISSSVRKARVDAIQDLIDEACEEMLDEVCMLDGCRDRASYNRHIKNMRNASLKLNYITEIVDDVSREYLESKKTNKSNKKKLRK